MTDRVGNFRRRRSWRELGFLLPFAFLPLALVGFSVRPALEHYHLSDEAEKARQLGAEAFALRDYLETFGPTGPPTAETELLLDGLLGFLPRGFELTEFYGACLEAGQRRGLEVQAILPQGHRDLELPADDLSVAEHRVVLQGRANSFAIEPFLMSLHDLGRPVLVHRCQLSALRDDPGRFEFVLELGALHLAPVVLDETDAGDADNIPS